MSYFQINGIHYHTILTCKNRRLASFWTWDYSTTIGDNILSSVGIHHTCAALGPIASHPRDSKGISELTLIQLIIYGNMSCIRGRLEIPIVFLSHPLNIMRPPATLGWGKTHGLRREKIDFTWQGYSLDFSQIPMCLREDKRPIVWIREAVVFRDVCLCVCF